MSSRSGADSPELRSRARTPGDELLGLERLDDVVVGTGLQPDDDVDGVALGREHDDRDAGLRPDPAAHLDAVDPGQHDVEQHEIGRTSRNAASAASPSPQCTGSKPSPRSTMPSISASAVSSSTTSTRPFIGSASPSSRQSASRPAAAPSSHLRLTPRRVVHRLPPLRVVAMARWRSACGRPRDPGRTRADQVRGEAMSEPPAWQAPGLRRATACRCPRGPPTGRAPRTPPSRLGQPAPPPGGQRRAHGYLPPPEPPRPGVVPLRPLGLGRDPRRRRADHARTTRGSCSGCRPLVAGVAAVLSTGAAARRPASLLAGADLADTAGAGQRHRRGGLGHQRRRRRLPRAGGPAGAGPRGAQRHPHRRGQRGGASASAHRR